MAIKINFQNLVRQLVPTHKRQPTRLWWLRTLVAPLGSLFGEFATWRRDTRMIIKVTSQVGIFEGYLRVKYGQPVSIKIVTFDDRALMVGLVADGESSAPTFTLDPTIEEPPITVPLAGEIRMQFDGADFIVYIPTELGNKINEIRADIERFKQAMVKYKIEQKITTL